MEFDLPIINFKDIDVSIFTIFFGLYLAAIGVAYYIIFHKHHKKNKVQIDELFSLITKFYTLTILSNITIILSFEKTLNSSACFSLMVPINSFKELHIPSTKRALSCSD